MKEANLTKIERYILGSKPVKYLEAQSKKIILPGFDKVPLYDVIMFFKGQLRKVGISDRASAIAFDLLMAIPAGTIFLFTLIPYMPVSSRITEELLNLTHDFAPNENTYQIVANFLNDFLNTPRTGLLSLGFLIAIYYASNATLGIMRSFNRSLIHVNERSFLHDRWTAIKLTIIFLLLIIATGVLLVTQGAVFTFIMNWLNIQSSFVKWVINSIRWLIIIALVLYGTGFIYKYAPAIHKRWKLTSPGAILATFLNVLFTFAFSFWVQNFGSYNKIYGSIGTIMILMLLVYFGCLILLIGYELNVSIHSLKALAEERQKHEQEADVQEQP